jgi:hypothetical protein
VIDWIVDDILLMDSMMYKVIRRVERKGGIDIQKNRIHRRTDRLRRRSNRFDPATRGVLRQLDDQGRESQDA